MPESILMIQKSRLTKMGKNGNPAEMKSLKESLSLLESLKSQVEKTNEIKPDGKSKTSEKEFTIQYALPDGDIREFSASSAQGLWRKICKDLTGIEPVYPALALNGRPTYNFKGGFNAVLRIIRESGCVIKALPDLE